MRFFTQPTAPSRPRSASSSSSEASEAADRRDLFPMISPPPPTRMNTAQPPRLPLSPATSPAASNLATTSSPSTESSIPRTYAAFPPRLHPELSEYDTKAAEATPIHYFSDNRHPQYVCKECMVPLALQDEVVSKAFSGSLGQAYLLHSTVNTYLGKKEDKRLLTGMHTVADLHCLGCQQLGRKSTVGWMYLKARERDQQYKEGKYILEAARVVKENNWSLED